jgi:hypothetical protein
VKSFEGDFPYASLDDWIQREPREERIYGDIAWNTQQKEKALAQFLLMFGIPWKMPARAAGARSKKRC